MFAKPRKMEESLPNLDDISSDLKVKSGDGENNSLDKKSRKEEKENQTPKKNPSRSPIKTRNVSLPNLRLKRREDKGQKEKRRMKRKRDVDGIRFTKKQK